MTHIKNILIASSIVLIVILVTSGVFAFTKYIAEYTFKFPRWIGFTICMTPIALYVVIMTYFVLWLHDDV